jgi:hypothetical protein
MVRAAVAEVDKLDRKVFSDPGLAGVLQKITANHEANIARVEGEVTAKRRETEREGRDSWGDQRIIKQKWLDVMIPFKGEAESFRIAPSRSTIPPHQADIGKHSLTISIPDDAGAENAVQVFIQVLNGNLDTLRQEYAQVKHQLQEAIDQAVARRQVQIKEESELDSNRTFRVVN